LSLLKKLADNVTSKNGTFTNSYPVIVNAIGLDNDIIEGVIRKAGDQDGHRTRAKCYRTAWDLHKKYETVAEIGQYAIKIANKNPLAGRTSPDGILEEIEYGVKECWGLIYKTGEETRTHAHWPSLWAFSYNVRACPKCSPLILPSNGPYPNIDIQPVAGSISVFPAWLNHYVPPQPCDHERIIIAGNLDIMWRDTWGTGYRKSI